MSLQMTLFHDPVDRITCLHISYLIILMITVIIMVMVMIVVVVVMVIMMLT